MNTVQTLACVVLLSPLVLFGCGSGGGSHLDPSKLPPGASIVTTAGGEEAVVYTQTQADKDFLTRAEPLTGSSAVLYVNGLGCPQCASNVDVQLLRLPGVNKANVDLSTGQVHLTFQGEKRPSPKRLNDAVEDAGFTLARVTTEAAPAGK